MDNIQVQKTLIQQLICTLQPMHVQTYTKVLNREEGWKGEKGQCNGHEPKIVSHIIMDILKYHFLQHRKNHSNSKMQL